MKEFYRKNPFLFLPNLLTLCNLCTGFLSMLLAAQGKTVLAAWLIVLALVWDSLDGNVARIFHQSSQLGKELDSLADIVSFVTAPAFLVSRFLLQTVSPQLLFLLFVYLACGAYRLARFNLLLGSKPHFIGLPTPAAGIMLVMSLLTCIRNDWTEADFFTIVMTFLVLSLGLLMISPIRYPKFSAIPFSQWRAGFILAILIFFAVLMMFGIEMAFVSVFLLYLVVGPIYSHEFYAATKQTDSYHR